MPWTSNTATLPSVLTHHTNKIERVMKKYLPLLAAVLLGLAVCPWLVGCSQPSATDEAAPAEQAPAASAFPRAAEGEFSVMTFNLNQYALVSRDGDPDTLEPKPREEAAAIIEAIRQAAPDVLAVQEMGDPAAWAEFKYSLRNAGLDYGHEEYLRRGKHELNIAVLSRFPIVEKNSHTDDTYTIGPAQFPVLRGFIDIVIEVNPGYRFQLIVAHLKSKVFHSFGQAEMRRNEARLLGNHVRAALKANASVNLLVVGDFNDEPASAPLREIKTYKRQALLHDLRPTAPGGEAWTRRLGEDIYHRVDYMLVSDGMLPEVVLDKTYVMCMPELLRASDHRPLVMTFVAREMSPEAAPDLSTRTPPEILDND
jgi:endonuclease/exonuclease/phosphatase family metal-dependent hydrolase